MVISLPRNPLPPDSPFGRVLVPGSKSVSNRVLLLAALAHGTSLLSSGLEAEDTKWMRLALKACGIPLHESAAQWRVEGGALQAPAMPLHMGASGTTLRFLLPVLALHLSVPVRMEGDPRLFERPLEPLLRSLGPLGMGWESQARGGILTPTRHGLSRLDVQVDAQLSSQFLTGLALAAASLPEGGRIRWDGTPTSASYLELTVHWLRRFGCESRLSSGTWEIPGGCLTARSLDITGDWSGAAAFLCAGAVTGRSVELYPLDPEEPQGDRALLPILEAGGCQTHCQADRVHLHGSLSQGLTADLTLCPDLGPVLAATAALAPAPSRLTGLHTLPHKECDRLQASAELVQWLGGHAEVEGDHTLRIWPGIASPSRPPFDPRNDHRMAFAAAVGGLRAGGNLLNPACVAKTYPLFWDAWQSFLMG